MRLQLDSFFGLRVLCIGDLMLDRYVLGQVDRVSPEAPIPVLRPTSRRAALGGVGNVAQNIASLGGEAVVVGIVGDDADGLELRGLLGASPRVIDQAVVSRSRPTTCKTRYMVSGHQILRLDEEVAQDADLAETKGIEAAIRPWIAKVHAVILSDYAKGAVTKNVARVVIERCNHLGVPVFVDTKARNPLMFRHATCLTPNLQELSTATGRPVKTDSQVLAAARRLLKITEAKAVLVTRSERGMTLVDAAGAVHDVRSCAREVFDVSGAGDTACAALALAYAADRPLPEAMQIANAAAGVAVAKSGPAAVQLAELIEALRFAERSVVTSPGLLNRAQAIRLVRKWKSQGLKVGFTNGCFDIFHAGHAELLSRASDQCDRLIVALNSDASVRRLKGPTRPYQPLASRAAVLSSIRNVDVVISFDEDTPLALIEQLTPDVLIKGADYRIEQVVGADVVHSQGGSVVLVPLMANHSTTGIAQGIGRTSSPRTILQEVVMRRKTLKGAAKVSSRLPS